MNLLATLRHSGAIDALSQSLDIAPHKASALAAALLPVVLAACRRAVDGLGDGQLPARVPSRLGVPHDRPPGATGSPSAWTLERCGAGDVTRIVAAVFGSVEAAAVAVDDMARWGHGDGRLLARALPLWTVIVAGYLAALAEAATINPDAGFRLVQVLGNTESCALKIAG